MERFTPTTINLDQETRTLLDLLLEKERQPGEGTNQSRTIRKLIREKAAALGIVAPKPDPKSNKQKAAA